jgi:glycosyltransferase involved in cell wall biosynthesis
MIVRNEATHLRRCLESVAGNVDRICITDTGSTDDTLAVAREFGAETRTFPWINDFSAARNASLANVAEDWNLILDADDHFPPGEAARLREVAASTDSPAIAFRYNIMPGHTPEPGLKLFRNGLDIRYEGLIHESIRNSLARFPSPAVLQTDIVLTHEGYADDVLDDKIQRNLPLLEAEYHRADRLGDRMQRLSVGVDLANAWIAGDRVEEGERQLRDLLDDMNSHGVPGDGRWELAPLVHLLWLLFEQNRSAEAAALCASCDSLFAEHPVFPLYRGMANLRCGDFDSALRDFANFDRTVASGPLPISIPTEYAGPELWHMAGQCCLSLGRNHDAVDWFSRALAAAPGNPGYAVKLQLAQIRRAS